MKLLVEPLGLSLVAEPGANLLDTLRAHQVPISYSCMAGRCGTCRCQLVSGVLHEAGPQAGDGEPLAQGEVLACRSRIAGDCVIEIPEPDEVITHPARVLRATVAEIEDMTHDIKRLRLSVSKPLQFSPGQYALLQFAPGLVRPYSMAGLPSDEGLEFHVRRVPDGLVSGYIAQELKVGDPVRVSGPLGTAYLRTKHEGPILCVAGGTGLAPVLSIVRGALESGMQNPIHLYFGVRTRDDVYALDVLRALERQHANLHPQIVVATGGTSADARMGTVTDAVASDLRELQGWRAYLCGSPPMVEAATDLARRHGVMPQHIHADAFYATAA